MKYFALAMTILSIGLVLVPPIVSWISLFDVVMAAWWFLQYRAEVDRSA